MQILKLIGNVVGTAFAIYLGIFLFWGMMFVGCLQHDETQCGGDLMTQTVRVVYAPLIWVMLGK
jgi:hypothetical protein